MGGDRSRRWLSPTRALTVAALLPFVAPVSVHEPAAAQDPAPAASRPVFATSDQCIACHSNIVDDEGADISIGHAWRATMMANAARDPYWQAAVRRESMDNPGLQAAIEDTCSTCHMPMARTAARADGRMGEVFAHTGRPAAASAETAQAWDGVSCTVCHQITADNFGEHESFDGGYVIATGALRPVRRYRGGAHGSDVLCHRIRPGAWRARPGVGALRHLPHALHNRLRRRHRAGGAVP